MPIKSFQEREVIPVTEETIKKRFFVFSEGEHSCIALVLGITAAGLEPHPSDRPNTFSLPMPYKDPNEEPLRDQIGPL